MSTEEQMATIGRMVTERAESKRLLATLDHKIQAEGESLTVIGGYLRHGNPTPENVTKSVAYIEGFSKAGGVENLLSMLRERIDVVRRLADLDAKLKEAGI